MCELNGENYLNIRLAIDLKDATVGENEHFAVISNSNNEQSIIPKFPNTKHWRIFDQHNGVNWLQIEENNLIAIFLVYSRGNNLFDIFEKTNKQKLFPLKDAKLLFLQAFVRGNYLYYILKMYALK